MYSAIDLSYAKKAGQCLTDHHSQPANNNFMAILCAKLCVHKLDMGACSLLRFQSCTILVAVLAKV